MLDPSENIFDDEMEILVGKEPDRIMGLWLTDAENEEERRSHAQTLQASSFQFDKLRRLLKQMYRSSQEHKEKLDSPNWKDRVAYEMGYQKALRDVYRLVPKTRKE